MQISRHGLKANVRQRTRRDILEQLKHISQIYSYVFPTLMKRYMANRWTESSTTNESQRNDSNDGTGAKPDATTREPSYADEPTSLVTTPQPANKPLVRRKSKWSILPRKSIDIAAH
jgi:hypothetical protein